MILRESKRHVVSLEEGSNLVVIDLCGGWHDLVCPLPSRAIDR